MKLGLAGPIILGILIPLCIIMKMLYHNDLIDPFKSVTVVTNGLGIFIKISSGRVHFHSFLANLFEFRMLVIGCLSSVVPTDHKSQKFKYVHQICKKNDYLKLPCLYKRQVLWKSLQ